MSIARDTIDVNVPVSTAYNQWTQFETFPEFMSGVEEVRQIDDKHLHWKVKVGGVAREWDSTITEQRPDQVIAWEAGGDTDNSGTVTFEKLAEDATRVHAAISYQAESMKEKVGDALHLPERTLKKDLAQFKAFIESRGQETGAWRGEV